MRHNKGRIYNKLMTVAVTQEQWDRINKDAKANGLSISGFVRGLHSAYEEAKAAKRRKQGPAEETQAQRQAKALGAIELESVEPYPHVL